jgi:hypothetical protein
MIPAFLDTYRRTLIAALACLLSCHSALAQFRNEVPEPDAAMARSGSCKVSVCTDFNFGDYNFRVYAPRKPLRLTEIPKGTCQCERVIRPGSDFNNSLLLTRETLDGRVRPNISLWRGPVETSYEEFKRLEPELEPLSDFSWKDDHFKKFRVFQTRLGKHALGARRYFFVPKEDVEFEFAGQKQPIAFSTLLAWRPDDPNIVKHGPRVAATIRLSNSLHFFQFLVPRITPSDSWISEIQETAEFIGTRLILRSDTK